jgi:hypothetical protein
MILKDRVQTVPGSLYFLTQSLVSGVELTPEGVPCGGKIFSQWDHPGSVGESRIRDNRLR